VEQSPGVPEGLPSRARVAVEVLLTAVAFAALSPALGDLWGGVFTETAARLEHGLLLVVVWPLEQAHARGWFDGAQLHGAAPWLWAVGLSLALTGLAAGLDPHPGVAPGRWRRVLAVPWMLAVGTPLLLAVLVVAGVGAALDPAVFATVLGAGVLGGFLGRSRALPLEPWERSLSGLPPASTPGDHMLRLALLWGALASLLATSAIAGLPFEEAPLRLAQGIEASRIGPKGLPWLFAPAVVLSLLAAPHTRRALARSTWEPWVAAVIGLFGASALLGALDGPAAGREAAPLGFALGLLGAVLAASGVPWLPRLAGNPLRSAGRLWLLLAAGFAVILHTVATGFLGCATVAADPRIEVLSTVPAPSAVAWTGGTRPAVFAAWHGEGAVLRLGLDDGETTLLNPADLQVGRAARRGEVRPALLGEGPGGRLYVLADVLAAGEQPATALVEVDPFDAAVLNVAFEPGPCEVATWEWNPILSVGLVGCRQTGEVLLYEQSLQRFLARQALGGAREVQALAVDPIDGALLSIARRKSPFAVRYDLERQQPRTWRFLGMSNLSLDLGADGLLRVPRFVGRQVLALDPVTLETIATARAGFALGPIVGAERFDRAVTASLADGHLYAVDAASERPTERLRVGGWVRDLAVSGDGGTLFAAGMCGVLAVDLEAWLR
jgi:hypothetical protein